ncbi:hypothetical protein GLOIN_2v1834226 [Rhizophagus irregularis DAOM 181602=DAOM 197198]|nr:hypothetical protein GLOIN_2v1834226 [Rhizophagus irregularis DAOM 181602=DAOM 197198]
MAATRPNYATIYTITIIFCFICTIQFSLIFICPILEFFKLQFFEKNEIPIRKPIEYMYLMLTFFHIALHLLLIVFCCFFERKQLDLEFGISTILWFVIPSIYTYYTIDELGDIPLFCPSNYPYKNSKLLHLCQIRIANLICMWIMFVITLIATIIMCVPEKTYKDMVGIDNDGRD